MRGAEMDNLDKLESLKMAEVVIDFLRRSVLHYGMWFSEIDHQLGLDEAIKIESEVFNKYFPLMLKRLSDVLGFEVIDDMPSFFNRLPRDKAIGLVDSVAANWLAGDGVWFQTVEQRHEMFTAKRCNDSCWTRFSPYEASRIKALLNLPDAGGLDALEKALAYRLYSRLNVQECRYEDKSLIFTMVNCRVQTARKRRGLADYPCKSAGIVEYSTFASTIDPRIKTECIACPPDDHPEEWFCSWKFYIS